jgi:hypothetical protein
MLQLILFLLASAGAGLIVTGWQGYKDSPWENFIFHKFIRSYIVAILVGLVFYSLDFFKLLIFDNFGVALLAILSVERAIGEIYKGFIRKQSHPEYIKLFERLNAKLKYSQRLIIGILLIASIATAIFVFSTQFAFYTKLPSSIAVGAIVGLIGGTLTAIGGAIKDSQFEGFKLKKFIRSPIVGILGGVIFFHFTKNFLLLLLSVTGFERITIEFYKTFLQRRVRGIFKNQKPVHAFWLKRRWVFFVLYAIGISILVLLTTLT